MNKAEVSSVPTPVERLRQGVGPWHNPALGVEAERIVRCLCESTSVVSVVAFGSAIRSNVESFDVDLLYIYDPPQPEIRPRNLEVDLRGYPRSRIDELIGAGHDLLSWSVKFGVMLCDDSGFWADIVSTWANRLPFPSSEQAIKRAGEAWKFFQDTFEVGDIDAALEQYVTYLTHEARSALIKRRIYPASRPELPQQLREIGELSLADLVQHALRRRSLRAEGIDDRVEQFLGAAVTRGQRSIASAA